MASAAAELFVKVSTDVAGLSAGFKAAEKAVKGLGDQVDQTAAAFKMMRSADASLEKTQLAASLLGRSFDVTAERIKHTEVAIAQMVQAGLKPGNAALDEATAKLRALKEAANAAAPKIDQTAIGFEAIAKNSQGFETARMRAKLLGTSFNETAERVKFAQKSVSDLIDMGLKPGDAAMDRAIVKLRQAQKAHDDTSASVSNHEKKTSMLGKVVAGLSFAAIGAGMAAFTKQAVTLASELEQNKVAFTTMLGSAERADALLRDLATFAANTPFELRGLMDSSKKLLAFGFDAKSVIPLMEGIGNAVAAVGGGKDVLDGVTMALGQMAAKGKVSAEEMNQLAERGIPAWKMLADNIGVSVPQAMKMAEKGSIDAGTAISALINGVNEKFPGMMDKQSRTFAGALSNLQDSADAALTKIGAKIIEVFRLTDIIRGLSDAIGGITNAITTGGLLAAMDKAFGPAAKATILGVGVALTGALTPAILAAVPAIGALALAWAPAVIAAGKFIAVGVAVAALAYPIIKNWDGIKGTITALFDTAATYASAWYNRASRVFSDFASVAGDAIRYVGDWIRNTFGVDIAAKLGVGMAKAGAAFRGFRQMAVEGLGIVTDSVTYAAQSFSADFTAGFNQGAAAVKAATGKITADMLGLAKNTDVATGAAKRKGDALRQAAQEAKKADAAFARLAATNQKAYERFELMAMSLTALGKRLQAVDLEAANQGRSFDLAGAKAKAYKDSLSAIDSAFGRMSTQAVNARAQMEAFAAASANGGAATAQAFKTIDDASAALERNRFAASELGKTWDEVEETLKSAEETLKSLIDQGLKPGNVAYDEAKKKLSEAQAQVIKTVSAFEKLAQESANNTQAFIRFGDSLGKVVEMAGVRFPSALGNTMGAITDGIRSVGELTIAFAGLEKAMKAVGAAEDFSVLFLALGFVLGVLKMIDEETKKSYQARYDRMEAERKEAEQIADIQARNLENLRSSNIEERFREEAILRSAAAAKQLGDSLQGSVKSALREATIAFIAGADDWAEKLRTNLKEAIFNGLMDAIIAKTVVRQFDDLINQIVDTFDKGTAAGRDKLFSQMAEKMGQTAVDMGESVMKFLELIGVGKGEAMALAQGMMGSVRGTRDAASAAAMQQYINAQTAGITQLRNQGYDWGSAKIQEALTAIDTKGEAFMKDLSARGMATGGLVTGPTIARMGEGGRSEAVLPLNESVYRQLGEGIAAARGGAGGAQVVVQYYGNGKWTREDAQGLGRMLVSELRSMGVK